MCVTGLLITALQQFNPDPDLALSWYLRKIVDELLLLLETNIDNPSSYQYVYVGHHRFR
jgi:hypothetical protein